MKAPLQASGVKGVGAPLDLLKNLHDVYRWDAVVGWQPLAVENHTHGIVHPRINAEFGAG